MSEERKPQDVDFGEIELDRKRTMKFVMRTTKEWEREASQKAKADLFALQEIKELPKDLSGFEPRKWDSFNIGDNDDLLLIAFVMMKAEDPHLSLEALYGLVPGKRIEDLRNAVADAMQQTLIRRTAEEVKAEREKEQEVKGEGKN